MTRPGRSSGAHRRRVGCREKRSQLRQAKKEAERARKQRGKERMTEREEDIAYWWEGGFPGAFHYVDPTESRLYAAFKKVLLAMPDEHFEKFTASDVTIVCLPKTSATIFRHSLVAPPGEEPRRLHMGVIYFAPHIGRYTDNHLAEIVAHEVAHVVLGHWSGEVRGEERADLEEAADRLSSEWGFKPRYSKKVLRKIREQDQRVRKNRRSRKGKG